MRNDFTTVFTLNVNLVIVEIQVAKSLVLDNCKFIVTTQYSMPETIYLYCIEAEHAIVNIKRKTIDLLKNHIYSKNEAFREYFTSSG